MKKLLIFITIASLFACARNTVPDNIELGEFLSLTLDGPVFVLTASSTFNADNEAKMFVNLELFKSNLVFRSNDEHGYHAEIEINYSVFKFDGSSRNRIINEYETVIVPGDPDRIDQGFDRLRFNRVFDIEPGRYEVEARITDKTSEVTQNRKVSTELPNLDSGEITSSEIIIYGIDTQQNENLIGTYDVVAFYDEIRFSFFISNPSNEDPVFVHMNLLNIPKDDAPARLLTSPNLPSSSLTRRGIDYRNMELVESQIRMLEPGMSAIEIEYQTNTPSRGAYRFEVRISDSETSTEADNIISTKARDFAIRPSTFPDIGTAKELAEPLIYLMNPSEYRELMSIESEEEMQRAVERFWIKNLGTAQRARDIMALYYERVVEANMQFTTFKEGWKTDMGMVYILFGRPWYVDIENDRIQWTYGYDRRDPLRTFQFFRSRVDTERFPFSYWVVRRNVNYHSVMYQQIQDWLSGYVMGRNFPY